MTGTAIVAGGSIGGLFAAAALSAKGWQVRVHERSPVELAGRGAGIVTHDKLISALEQVGASTRDLGVSLTERVAFDKAGNVVHRMHLPQIVTSWDRVYQVLRQTLPDGAYQLGGSVVRFDDRGDSVLVELDDGTHDEADLLVGADGFRSAIRGQMLPDVTPRYSGYVVWRALVREADFPEDLRNTVFPHFGFFLPRGTQIIAYPIAGPENDLRPGHRRYNIVWYSRVDPADLPGMLTDTDGTQHALTIPPPKVRDDVLDAMKAEAERDLPRPFVRILERSERPFFTPIYDHQSPVMAQGRVALSGDAACVARPHVGMGVTKAADDALALADHVSAQGAKDGLMAYSAERVPASGEAHHLARELGAQIFYEGAADENRDGRDHPVRDWVMKTTAVYPGEAPASA